MLVSMLADCCIQKGKTIEGYPTNKPRLAHEVAIYIDLVIAIALVAIGILAAYGVIPLSSMTAFSLMAAGGTYSVILTAASLSRLKEKCCPETFLISAPED